MRYDLDRALMQQPRMRNYTITTRNDETIYLAQFDADTGPNVWALEVAFVRQHDAWGWRTGARNLKRDNWHLVDKGDARCRDFAIQVAEHLRTEARRMLDLATGAAALARSHD